MKHSQRTQRLNEPHLPEIEIRELRITFQQLAPLPALIGTRSGKQHPKILDTWAGGAIVEIHEGRPLLVPQQITEVTVAVDAYFPQWTRLLERLLDTLEQCFA